MTRALELKLGRKFAAARMNEMLDSIYPAPYLVSAYADGAHWSYGNSCLDNQHANQPLYTFADCAAGQLDAKWRQVARTLMTNSRWTASNPYHFCFHHEPSQAVKQGFGSAADYIAAYRHVRRLFDAEGATVVNGGNVRFVYTPTYTHIAATSVPLSAADTDPGSAYYDLIGVDHYAHLQKNGMLSTPASEAPTIVRTIKAFAAARGKNWFFAELGVADGSSAAAHVQKAAFVNALCAAIKTSATSGTGRCVALCWSNTQGMDNGQPGSTNRTKNENYHLGSSATALAAYKKWGADPAFGAKV